MKKVLEKSSKLGLNSKVSEDKWVRVFTFNTSLPLNAQSASLPLSLALPQATEPYHAKLSFAMHLREMRASRPAQERRVWWAQSSHRHWVNQRRLSARVNISLILSPSGKRYSLTRRSATLPHVHQATINTTPGYARQSRNRNTTV